MKLALLLVVIVSAFANSQEKPGADQESLVADRKKQIEEHRKQHQAAVEQARQQTLAEPNSAEAHFKLADTLKEGPDTEDTRKEIERSYSRAIQLKPDYAEAILGLAMLRRFKREERLEAIQKAIALKPDYAEAYGLLGTVHLGPIMAPHVQNEEEAQRAARAFEKAVELKPDWGDAYMGLGLSNHHLKNYSEALEAFKKAVFLNPSNILSRFMLGLGYVRLGNEQAAMEQYDGLLRCADQMEIDSLARGESPDSNGAKTYADLLVKEIQKRFLKK